MPGPTFQNEYGGGQADPNFTDWGASGYKPEDKFRSTSFPYNSAGEPYINPQIGRELENWGPKFAGQKVRNYDGTWTTWEAKPNNYLDAFRNGTHFRTNVAMQGGNDKSTFRFSYTNENQNGIVSVNSFNKNGLNLRVTHEITKFLTADISVDYTATNDYNPQLLSQDGAYAYLGGENFGKDFTWVVPRNYDTKYWMQRNKYISQVYGGLINPSDATEPNKAPNADFWFYLYETSHVQKEQMLRGRVSLAATLTNWAKFVVETNLSNNYVRNENSQLGEGRFYSGGSYSLSHGIKHTSYLKGMLLMNKAINKDFNISGNIGAEMQSANHSFTSAATSGGLIYPGSYFIANSKNTPTAGGKIDYTKETSSIYASADIDYKAQYYLNLTWRADWSSTLMKTDGTGNFKYNYPAASASWLFFRNIQAA